MLYVYRRLFLSDFNQNRNGSFRVKFRNIIFHEDSISGSRIVKLVQTEG